MSRLDARSVEPKKLAKIRAVGWLAGNLEAAERVARCEDTSPVPRGELAMRFRQFVAMFDRERAWDTVDQGSEIRKRALAVADALEAQAERARQT